MTLKNGPELVFGYGRPTRAAKWTAAARVLAEISAAGSDLSGPPRFPGGWPQEGSRRIATPSPDDPNPQPEAENEPNSQPGVETLAVLQRSLPRFALVDIGNEIPVPCGNPRRSASLLKRSTLTRGPDGISHGSQRLSRSHQGRRRRRRWNQCREPDDRRRAVRRGVHRRQHRRPGAPDDGRRPQAAHRRDTSPRASAPARTRRSARARRPSRATTSRRRSRARTWCSSRPARAAAPARAPRR